MRNDKTKIFSLFQINYGSLLLQALLEHWSLTHTHTSNDEVIKGNEYFSVPKHTPVIFRYICESLDFERYNAIDCFP